MPLDNAQILIHEPSRRGLAALYRKAKMPEALYGAVLAAVDVVDETGFDGEARDLERFRSRVISRILTLVENVDQSDADYLLDKLGDVLVHTPIGEEKGVLVSAPGSILFRFHARDLHLVLAPGYDGKPVHFRILLDGVAPGSSHGVDTDAGGNGVVTEQRLYQLIRQPQDVKQHTFTIEFLDPGVRAYAFTFG